MKKLNKALMGMSICGALIATSSLAEASAFQLWEQNASGTGDYHAGGAAEAADASTLWYNPAGMTRLKKPELVAGAVGIQYKAHVKGSVTDTTNATISFESIPLGTSTAPVNKTSSVFRPVPFGYFTMPLGQKWAAGLGITTPFGLETNYSPDSYLKYAATYSGLTTVDITPALAYQATSVISMGLGLDFMYAKGTFNLVTGIPGADGEPNNFADTNVRNAGDGWGVGYHLGMLFQFTPNTRVGFAYHSQIVENLKGHSTASGPTVNPGFPGGDTTPMYTQTNNLKSTITLPASMELSGYHDFNAQWAGLASATYTWWSSFQNLKFYNVAYQPGVNTNSTVAENYGNTWNFALGVHYTPIQVLTLKMGAGYDVTPSTDADRNVQLPDETRFVLAGGVHYQAMKNLGLDAGYAHIFFHDARINVTQVNSATASGITTTSSVTTNGSAQNYANLFGVQLTYDFD